MLSLLVTGGKARVGNEKVMCEAKVGDENDVWVVVM